MDLYLRKVIHPNASDNCHDRANGAGVSYVPKGVRAAEALKANPQKSNRALANDLGISEGTIRNARKSGAQDYAPDDDERIGRWGGVGDGRAPEISGIGLFL